MGGVEGSDEPPSKRVKPSSAAQLRSLGNCSSYSGSFDPLGGTMARPSPSQGEYVVGSRAAIKREEFVRIITNALYSLGYERSGAALEEESGIELHSAAVSQFRKQVLSGNWDESVAALREIGNLDDEILKSASFLIMERKFFELLEKGNVMAAMRTLQKEITVLGIRRKRVHELASCLVSSSQRLLLGFTKLRLESSDNARQELLEELQKLFPPTVMIPERRLEHLVEQALSAQRNACYFHNSMDSLSLYTDHQCGKDQIPSRTIQVLCAHRAEVWFLQFSNNGKYLASSSKDGIVIIWEVHEDDEVLLVRTLDGHQKPVVMVAWSPDDSQLLSCGMEEVVRRWDVHSGKCIHIYEKPGLGSVSCSWSPDGKQLFSSLTDKTFCSWNLDGQELDCWKGQRSTRTSDIAVTGNGKFVVTTDKEGGILLLNRESKTERRIEEDQKIISFTLSKDGTLLLLNLLNEEIHLWSIDGEPQMFNKLKGFKRSRFVIRSCFGGSGQAFVASGSEDSQVYIWHRASGELIKVLPGHSGTVNCVSWNPTNAHMLASASDDGTVRIWVPKERRSKQSSATARHSSINNGVAHMCNGTRK